MQKGIAKDVLPATVDSTVEGFPDLSFEITNVIASSLEKSEIALEWLMKGTNTGPFFGEEPTGKVVAIAGVDIIKVIGNKINTLRSYYNENEFAKQLVETEE